MFRRICRLVETQSNSVIIIFAFFFIKIHIVCATHCIMTIATCMFHELRCDVLPRFELELRLKKFNLLSKKTFSFIHSFQEGQAVSSVAAGAGAGAAVRAAAEQAAAAKREPVHVRTEEKLVAEVPRDGGLKSAEVRIVMIILIVQKIA